MKVNNQTQIQQKTPNFGARMIKPNQLNKAPYVSVPLALGALATLGMAQLLLDSKSTEKILTPEEIEETITNMQKADGTARFSDFEISSIKYRYEKNNVNKPLFIKLINLKSADGEYLLDFYDIIQAHEKYENHPEFSEFVINDVPNLSKTDAKRLASYMRVESSNQELLMKLYNRREKGSPTIEYYNVNQIIEALETYPEYFTPLLDEKYTDKDNYNYGKYKYNNYSILELYEAYKKDPKLTDELLKMRDFSGNLLSVYKIYQIVSSEEEQRNTKLELLRNLLKTRIEIIYYDDIYQIKEKNPELIDAVFASTNVKGECPFDFRLIEVLKEKSQEEQNLFIELAVRGVPGEMIKKTENIQDLEVLKKILDEGVSYRRLLYLINYKKLDQIFAEEKVPNTPMKEFFKDSNYIQKIKENSAGKYQKELMQLFDAEKIPYVLYSDLVNSDISVEDFLSSLRKISKSSFKLAYDTPNQYLNGLSSEISTQLNGHYPKLEEKELSKERSLVLDFFIDNFSKMVRILKYIDSDTLNHLMDKRFNAFSKDLETISRISDENLELMQKLLQCKSEKTLKSLTVKEKMQVYEIVKYFSIGNFNAECLKNSIKNGIVNTDSLKEILSKEILKSAGIDLATCNVEDLNFNKEYFYLILKASVIDLMSKNEKEEMLLQISEMVASCRKNKKRLETHKQEIIEILASPDTQEMMSPRFIEKANEMLEIFSNIENFTDKEIIDKYLTLTYEAMDIFSVKDKIQELIKAVASGNFEKYINDTNNVYGKANLKTKEIFEAQKLHFDKWQNPMIEPIEFEIAGKKLSMKLWERNPFEDLFMGNKTTCCTGIGKTNGAATPIYIMSKCWNVVQMFDDKGELVGMSRIFVGEKDGECSIMMDNIELNNNFVKNMTLKEKEKIRDKFFEYIHKMAEEVFGTSETKVYFYRGDTHTPTDGLEEYNAKFNFVGENPTNSVYINSYNMRWCNPQRFGETETKWYIVPKQ